MRVQSANAPASVTNVMVFIDAMFLWPFVAALSLNFSQVFPGLKNTSL